MTTATAPAPKAKDTQRAADIDGAFAFQQAIVKSPLMVDAVVICKAAAELERLVAAFLNEHDSQSMVRVLRRKGLLSTSRQEYVTTVTAHLLRDLGGLRWCLEAAQTLIEGELLESPNIDGKETTGGDRDSRSR